MGRNFFAKEERLKKTSSIGNVFDKGASFRNRLTTVFLLKRENGPGVTRVAFVIKKDLCRKKAVLRNRFKRVLREAYRRTKHALPPGYDMVIMATCLTIKTKSYVVESELTDVFRKCCKS